MAVDATTAVEVSVTNPTALACVTGIKLNITDVLISYTNSCASII
ncbi:hypothetical protein SPWS13_4330 [Shewanella putrefaciens]|nr:hypothetical protein SPWS13_4330 [Shewanella putrefaciens]